MIVLTRMVAQWHNTHFITSRLRVWVQPLLLASGFYFTNILWAAFVPKSFCQKITNPNCKHIKAAQKTFVRKAASKILVKLTPGWIKWQNIIARLTSGNSTVVEVYFPTNFWKQNHFFFFSKKKDESDKIRQIGQTWFYCMKNGPGTTGDFITILFTGVINSAPY